MPKTMSKKANPVNPTTLFSQRATKSDTRRRKVSLREARVKSVGICGVGLIGASIAESLRSSSRTLRIVGHDKPKVINVALRERVIDAQMKPNEMTRSCDLIILAANPASNRRLLQKLARQNVAASALIIDTGSTQNEIAELNLALRWNNDATFIAGHPMAGREVQGIESRMKELFAGHPFFFDSSVKLNSQQLRILDWFTNVLGSYSMYVDNERHDSVMTDISHIPQLLSTVISGFVSHYDKRTVHLAGTGLKSMIRLGGSPYSNWRDVFADNDERLCQRLDMLIDELKSVRAKIGSGESLTKSFQKAKRSYSCLW